MKSWKLVVSFWKGKRVRGSAEFLIAAPDLAEAYRKAKEICGSQGYSKYEIASVTEIVK